MGEPGTAMPMPREGFSPAVGSHFASLRDAVVRFSQRPDEPFLPHEIGFQMEHLAQSLDILNRDFARLAGVFAKTGEAERQGSNGEVKWTRHHCNMSASDAGERVVVGRFLEVLPAASKALDEGHLGFGHLVHMARNAAFIAGSKTGVFAEGPLLERAVKESVSRFGHTARSMRHMQDPEGYAVAEANNVESRELLVFPQDDGMTFLSLRLDATGAATVLTAVRALSKKLGSDDFRTSARRDADAVVEMAQFILNSGTLPVTGGQRPHINVTCTLETLMGLTNAPAAQLEYGMPVSRVTVNRLCCDSEMTKILLDEKLIPVAIGHMKRTLTRKERQALDARDGGCRYPGCSRQPSQCEAHHIEFWSRGGKTKLDNMILLCMFHHWRVHEGGWLLGLSSDGRVLVTPPHLAYQPRGPGTTIAA